MRRPSKSLLCPCYLVLLKCGQHMEECIFQLSTIFELVLCSQILEIDNTNTEHCNKSWIVQILCRNVERTSQREKWHLLYHVWFCLFLSVLLKNMKMENFCLMMTAKHFFLCWLYKETESASTKYNASDIDLLLSCHIVVILNKLFFQMWIRETSRWLKRKKGKARHPFKFFWWGLSTDERFLLFRSCKFLVFELFEYWGSCTCYGRKHFPPTVPPMLRFKYGLHLSY